MKRNLLLIPFFLLTVTTASAQYYDIIPFESQGKWGLLNPQKQMIVVPKYDSIGFNESGLGFIIKNEEKYGILDPNGKLILNCEFKKICDTLDYFVVDNGKKRFYYDPKRNLKIDWSDDFLDDKQVAFQVQDVSGGKTPFRKNTYDTQKNYYLINPGKDTVKIKKERFFTLYEEGIPPIKYYQFNKTGAIWGNFDIITSNALSVWGKIKYDTLLAQFDSLQINLVSCKEYSLSSKNCLDKARCFLVKKDEKWGVIGIDKQVKRPIEWDYIEWKTGKNALFSKYNLIQKNNLWGWMSSATFEVIVEPKYTLVRRVPTKIPDIFFYVETSTGKKGYVSVNTGKAYF